MFVRLSAAIAAVSLLSSAALAQGAKPTDPQIAHIALHRRRDRYRGGKTSADENQH